MKKTGLVLSIIGVGAILALTIYAIIYNGTDLAGMNYVKLSVNPQIEFVCEGDRVVSCNALNEEAKTIIAQEEFIDLNVDDACVKFVDLCTRAGYINLDASDNAVKVDCVSGLTQNLEAKVYKAVNDYLKGSEILGVVLESNDDSKQVKESKENGVPLNKFILINSCMNLDDNLKLDELKKYSQSELIKKINELHQKIGNPTETYTQEDLTNKHLLIDFNRIKYAKHMDSITEESLRAFAPKYTENQKELRNKVHNDFDGAYGIWQKNHINFIS